MNRELEELKEEEEKLDGELLDDVSEYIDEIYDEKEIQEEVNNKDEEISTRPTSTVQYNGTSYMTVIPKKIIRITDLAKKDKIEWSVKKKNDELVMVLMINPSDSFKLPVEKREDGR